MKFLVILPLIILATGWLLGHMRLYRALVAFITWWTFSIGIGTYIFIYGIANHGDNPLLFFFAGLMAIVIGFFGFWIAMLASITSRQMIPSPAKQIAAGVVGAYRNLDDDQKQMMHAAARKASPIIARGVASYLEKKGWPSTAGALRETSHML